MVTESLHDWSLHSLDLVWETGALRLQLVDISCRDRTLQADNLMHLDIPRCFSWGKSNSILEHQLQHHNGYVTLRLLMQSGDTLTITAHSIQLH